MIYCNKVSHKANIPVTNPQVRTSQQVTLSRSDFGADVGVLPNAVLTLLALRDVTRDDFVTWLN